MIGLKLSSGNDIVFKNGDISLVSESEEVVQNVKCRLMHYLSEWFMDESLGVPYFEKIFTKPANIALTESILKKTIIQTTGVNRLKSFYMSFDSPSRSLSITFTVLTDYSSDVIDGTIDI